MSALLIVVAIIAGLFVLVCALAGIAEFMRRRLHPDGYESSPQKIRAELQKIADGEPWAFDDFISVGPLKDPRLEAMRQRCAGLDEEFPPESDGQNFGPKGLEVIRGFIRELEMK